MFRPFSPRTDYSSLITSRLYDETTFYQAFARDLEKCRKELIIESPFITSSRSAALLPTLQRLIRHGARITVNTRDPVEHASPYDAQAREMISRFQSLGIRILFTGSHHRKLAIVDRGILWEGSLNILSQADSCEVMRRIESQELAVQMLQFTKIDKFL